MTQNIYFILSDGGLPYTCSTPGSYQVYTKSIPTLYQVYTNSIPALYQVYTNSIPSLYQVLIKSMFSPLFVKGLSKVSVIMSIFIFNTAGVHSNNIFGLKHTAFNCKHCNFTTPLQRVNLGFKD